MKRYMVALLLVASALLNLYQGYVIAKLMHELAPARIASEIVRHWTT